jgi:hypothetical protein
VWAGRAAYVHPRGSRLRLSSCEPTSVVHIPYTIVLFSFLLAQKEQTVYRPPPRFRLRSPPRIQPAALQPSLQLKPKLQAAGGPHRVTLLLSSLRLISSLSNIPPPVWRPDSTPASSPRVFSSQAGLSLSTVGPSQWPLAAPPPQLRLRRPTFQPLLQLPQKKIAPAHSPRAPPTPSPVRLRRSLFTFAARASKAASPAEEPLIHLLPDQKQTIRLGSLVVLHPPRPRPPSALSISTMIMATRPTSPRAAEVHSQTSLDGGALPLTRVTPPLRVAMSPHPDNPIGRRSTLLSPGAKPRLRSRRPKAARPPLAPSASSLYPQRRA